LLQKASHSVAQSMSALYRLGNQFEQCLLVCIVETQSSSERTSIALQNAQHGKAPFRASARIIAKLRFGFVVTFA
jgi:hypothetical protein